jgi:CubicO group peptidase (beta-lactamase class C family)
MGETAYSPARAGLSAEVLARMDETLAGFVAQGALPGVAVLVVRHGKVVHRATLGLKDIASGEPLAADTIYRIFSMTKPVTAVAMMLLHEQGRWSPDDPIAKHLPEFGAVKGPGGAAVGHAPTMGELMTHTAGFGYGIGLGPHDATDAAYIAGGVWEADSLAEMSRRVAAVPLAYQPGSAWRYSLSMDLQGAVIEKLAGQSLPDFMRERIFTPLGMADTDFFVPVGKLPRLASLYHMYGMSELTVLDHPSFVRDPKAIPKLPSGGGGLYSTITDYGRFAQMLLNRGELDGARILKPQSVAMMTANHLPQTIMDKGVLAGMQRIGPGRGYGFNGAVFGDPVAAGSPVGRGTYQWDGASGVWFWVDPENDLIFVGMIQRMMQEGMPRLQELTQALVAEALAAGS